jgi:hypothetical protein
MAYWNYEDGSDQYSDKYGYSEHGKIALLRWENHAANYGRQFLDGGFRPSYVNCVAAFNDRVGPDGNVVAAAGHASK